MSLISWIYIKLKGFVSLVFCKFWTIFIKFMLRLCDWCMYEEISAWRWIGVTYCLKRISKCTLIQKFPKKAKTHFKENEVIVHFLKKNGINLCMLSRGLSLGYGSSSAKKVQATVPRPYIDGTTVPWRGILLRLDFSTRVWEKVYKRRSKTLTKGSKC